jgi:hypothetical protein
MAGVSTGVLGWQGEPPRYTGIDIIITRDGQISALYVFLNSTPA